jgi:hypothetical protein
MESSNDVPDDAAAGDDCLCVRTGERTGERMALVRCCVLANDACTALRMVDE